MHIAHLTSAHPRYDVRIFRKMCRSLASDHSVSLVVADDLSGERVDDVEIVDVGRQHKGRLGRMTKTVKAVLQAGVNLDADVYHLHDPELMPAGRRLVKLGKKVVFDAHEDLPKQILAKPYLSATGRRLLARVSSWYENRACSGFDGVIAATPVIRDKFLAVNENTVDVCNFPLLEEFGGPPPTEARQNEVCYVGGIAKVRGIFEITDALEQTRSGARLNLCGEFGQASVAADAKGRPGWKYVNEHGFVSREKVREVLGRSVAGLVTLHPVINYIEALPVKMFEYMGAGVPVIASDFPSWREIIDRHQCGLLVDPLQPADIAGAIDFLVANPEEARQMGERGRAAVLDRYNWDIEERKLLDFYRSLAEES